MLSLAEISSKYTGTANLVNRGGQNRVPRPPENVDDPEWEIYLHKIQTEPDQAMPFLRSEFERKTKESGGKCVEYLRKLFVHSHRLSRTLNGKADSERSVIMLFRTLFGLAKGEWSLPSQIIDDVMACGINAIRDFPSAVLVKYLKLYAMVEMQDAEKEENLNSRWIEMFVRFIAVLSERGDIPHESDTMKGKEYRVHIIEEICRMDWTKPVLKSYLTILEEIPGLEVEETDSILDKFGSTLRTMEPKYVQDCVGQIVGIAGNLCPSRILATFDKYFTDMQEKQRKDESPAGPASRKRQQRKAGSGSAQKVSLGIVACNFVESSRHCDSLIREILKRVKASVFDHTLIMTPFVLSVVLALTNVDYLKDSIIDPLKTAILKNFHELNLCGESCWYKDTIGEIRDDITLCFKYVMKEGSSAMDYMCDGLKDLGISLLNSNSMQVKYPMTFKRCQELGTYLVTTVVMTNKEQLGLLLKELLKPDSTAHIDCLAACLSQCSRAVGQRDFHGRISELLHHLPSMSVESASAIIKSLLPTLQMSPALLDDLMIVLRKTFWKSVDAGRICVEVICVILSNTYLMGNSQFQISDAPNDDLILSQLTQGNSRTNVDYTPLCREILNLGKRFFLLDCKVREQLYLGLHRVARRNPMVNDLISGQLHTQMSQYVQDELCPIKFQSLFEFFPLRDCKAGLKDELGFLVQCMGFVYNKTNLSPGEFLDGDNNSITNCGEMLKKLIINLIAMVPKDLEYEISSIIGSSEMQTNDVKRYVKDIVCNQTRQIIEALIEFMALATDWPNAKNDIKTIFERYLSIQKFSKENPNAKKGKTGKAKGTGKGKKVSKKADVTNKGDTTKTTEIDTDTETASVASGSETIAKKVKRIDTSLKPPPYFHIINLDSVCQMLRELYGPYEKTKHLKNLHGDVDFELILLATVRDKVHKLKSKESIRERQRAPVDTLNSLTCLIETIWERFCTMSAALKRNDSEGIHELIDVESTQVVEMRLEVITSIINYFHVENHVPRVKYFSKYLLGADRDDEKFCVDMFEEWKQILQMISESFDGIRKNGNALMFSLLNLICQVLTSIEVLQKIQLWCWSHFQDNAISRRGTSHLVENAITTFLVCNVKCSKLSSGTKKDALRLAKTIPLTMGTVLQDDEEPGTQSWLITKDTVPTLFVCISTYVEKQIAMLNTILGRLKAHRQYLGLEKSIEMRDKCFEMIQSLRRIITELVRSRIDAGPCIGSLLKVVTQFYSVLSGFAEHLIDVNKTISEPVNIRGFKSIATDLGREMKPLIEAMIPHVELVQREKMTNLAVSASAKKSAKLPAMVKVQFSKDARLIPNMVYHIERFDQFVIALSKKVKIDMLVGMKLSTARDFRIDGTLHNVFAAQDSNESIGSDTADDTTAAASSSRPATSSTGTSGTEKPGSKLSRKRKL